MADPQITLLTCPCCPRGRENVSDDPSVLSSEWPLSTLTFIIHSDHQRHQSCGGGASLPLLQSSDHSSMAGVSVAHHMMDFCW